MTIMKKMILAMAILFTMQVNAQNKTANSKDYKTAVGLKFWEGVGLNLKTFLNEKTALDITGFFWKEGTLLSANYEFHGDLNTEGNLKWYLGAGANVSFIKVDKSTVMGVQGVVGLDYKFKTLPLNVALDWQPTLRFKKGFGYTGEIFGLMIRYTL